MFGATLLLAMREIRRHLLRSFLTTLGIVIGVAAVVTMVTLGNGVTASVQNQISSLGSNVLIVLPTRGSGSQVAWRPFKEADVTAVSEQIAGVEYVAGSVSKNVNAYHNGQVWQTSVRGADMAFLLAQSMQVERGRGFTSAEESAGKDVCIIGQKVEQQIFVAGIEPMGETMRLANVPCTVVGVMKERGTSGGGQDEDNQVIMPLKTVQRRFTGNNDLQYFVVKYASGYSGTAVQDALVQLLRQRRLLQAGEGNNFNIIDTAQVNQAVSAATGALTAMVAAIAAISLAVGGIGIMNIMLVSVTERTREIGIRLAIGALAREVRMQFLTEAVVLCCFGGLTGLVLAFALSFGLSKAIDVPFMFSPMVNVLSFLFSALMGIAFGYYPARRASRLDPIEALRHE
ncbi:ABC transporter permease [Novosphingobium beihaiensis]|uniref:ABC transporter permease n=1 Tax=Novosphingobium beihaiensis TaxID=2930389 RepID=A0ABT0BSA0_9SPHN|nr:ABC transporter permease [Novosphingobium beihaiensis]MCJ2187666.1 ABC transporter permease [Novosphingobium beihaiensis]